MEECVRIMLPSKKSVIQTSFQCLHSFRDWIDLIIMWLIIFYVIYFLLSLHIFQMKFSWCKVSVDALSHVNRSSIRVVSLMPSSPSSALTGLFYRTLITETLWMKGSFKPKNSHTELTIKDLCNNLSKHTGIFLLCGMISPEWGIV